MNIIGTNVVQLLNNVIPRVITNHYLQNLQNFYIIWFLDNYSQSLVYQS